MSGHLRAWRNEYRKSIWKGHYSLGPLQAHEGKGRLLDAGCGSGKYAIPLRMRGFDVVGMDISFEALGMLREGGKIRELDIDIAAASVFQMPFKNGSFDVVWCYGVLQHLLLWERQTAVKEFKRILREEGFLFIEVFGKKDMRYGGTEVEPGTFSRKNGIVYHYFDTSEIQELLRDFSCDVTEICKQKRFGGKFCTRHMISATAKSKTLEKRTINVPCQY